MKYTLMLIGVTLAWNKSILTVFCMQQHSSQACIQADRKSFGDVNSTCL